jgi:predicted nucleotidyltransferase
MLPEIVNVRDKIGHERQIILVGGRVKGRFRISYDTDGVYGLCEVPKLLVK